MAIGANVIFNRGLLGWLGGFEISGFGISEEYFEFGGQNEE